jgi:hypothetical protein
MLARTSLLLVVAVIAKVTLAQDGDYKVRKTAESCHVMISYTVTPGYIKLPVVKNR